MLLAGLVFSNLHLVQDTLLFSWFPMSTGSAHHYLIISLHQQRRGSVGLYPTELPLTSTDLSKQQYLECSGSPKTAHFRCGIRPKEGDTQASAIEAGNKPILSAALPLRCLPTPTWVAKWNLHWYTIRCCFHGLLSGTNILCSKLGPNPLISSTYFRTIPHTS